MCLSKLQFDAREDKDGRRERTGRYPWVSAVFGADGNQGMNVSVILPVYNAMRTSPHYLPEAIESVLGQTMADFELIVIDDGSDEDYSRVRERYGDSRIRWHRLEHNAGQSAARNKGVEMAQADKIAFIDQDDRWYPDRLQTCLEHHNGCAMTYSDLDEIDESGEIIARSVLKLRQAGRHPWKSVADILAQDALVLPGTCLFDKSVFLKAGRFDPQLSGCEDDDLFLRVFQMGPIRFVPKALMQYRIYGESARSSSRTDTSRHLYFQKLVQSYPDDKLRGRYWVRDKIAPRFASLWLTRLRDSVRHRQPAIYDVARQHVRTTSCYGRFRLKMGGILLSMIPYAMARVIYRLPRFKYLVTVLFSMRRRARKGA